MLKNLRKLRDETGITQKQLAEAIGVSQQSINKYENHSVEPDIDTMVRIADYFDTSVDYLIGNSLVRRRIESVSHYDLNQEEEQLLLGYRQLTKKQRRIILDTIESFTEG